MRHLLLLFLLTAVLPLSAQIDSTSRYARSPVYFHLGVGFLPISANASGEISTAVGYRFSRHASLGLEYRFSGVATIGSTRSASLFGLHVRGQGDDGWMASVGLGLVGNAARAFDDLNEWEYTGGGFYAATDFGYQFPSGVTLGGYVTYVTGQNFNLFERDLSTDELFNTGQSVEDSFFGLGLKVGYAFPGRGRRSRR